MARRRPPVEDDDELPRKKKKPKKSRSRDLDDALDEIDDDFDDVEKTPSANNAYTGMLAITLVAFIAAALLLYLDASKVEAAGNIAAPTISVQALGANTAAPAAPAN